MIMDWFLFHVVQRFSRNFCNLFSLQNGKVNFFFKMLFRHLKTEKAKFKHLCEKFSSDAFSFGHEIVKQTQPLRCFKRKKKCSGREAVWSDASSADCPTNRADYGLKSRSCYRKLHIYHYRKRNEFLNSKLMKVNLQFEKHEVK